MPATTPPRALLCANNPCCSSKAALVCGNCKLVKYCAKPCQVSHWQTHKSVCRSPMSKETWLPGWEAEKRPPMWADGSEQVEVTTHGTTAHGVLTDGMRTLDKMVAYLWGNKPAIGVGPLGASLGRAEYKNLLFPASGDLRDVATMVNQICAKQVAAGIEKQELNLVLNDLSPPIVMRNLLILIVLGEGQVDAAIELWYNPRISEKTHYLVKSITETVFMNFLLGMMTSARDEYYTLKHTLCSGATIVCSAPVVAWKVLIHWLVIDADRSRNAANKAAERRRGVTQNPERKDFYDRHLVCIRPSWRNACDLYEADGIVAPFQDTEYRASLTKPNPTLFTPIAKHFMHFERASPLAGWPLSAVIRNPSSSSPAPPNDLYGHLYFYLHATLSTFSTHLTASTTLNLTAVNAQSLPALLHTLPHAPRTYDFIDVSNITDHNHVGIPGVLTTIGALLAPAGLLQGLFMSYPRFRDQLAPPSERQLQREHGDSQARALAYGKAMWVSRMGSNVKPEKGFGGLQYRVQRWMMQLTRWEEVWADYARVVRLGEVSREAGFRVKRVVRPWVLKRAEVGMGTDSEWVRGGEMLEELVLGEVKGGEVYVQWVRGSGEVPAVEEMRV